MNKTLVMSPNGAQNQEQLRWRGPAAILDQDQDSQDTDSVCVCVGGGGMRKGLLVSPCLLESPQ
jgi:hypothetical protein